jgi:hypothetical protein
MSWDINSGNRCGPRNELSVIRLDQDTGNIYYDVLWGFDVWDVVTIVTSSLRGQARARDRKVHKHLLNCFNHVDVLAQLVFTYWARANVIDLLRKKFQLHGVFNWQGPKKSLPNKERVMNNRHYKEPLVEVKKFHDVSFQRDLSLDSQRWFILDCPSIPELAYLCSPSLTRVEIQHIVACNQLVGIYKGKPFFIF